MVAKFLTVNSGLHAKSTRVEIFSHKKSRCENSSSACMSSFFLCLLFRAQKLAVSGPKLRECGMAPANLEPLPQGAICQLGARSLDWGRACVPAKGGSSKVGLKLDKRGEGCNNVIRQSAPSSALQAWWALGAGCWQVYSLVRARGDLIWP